jgi:hypothetical protein
MDEIKIARKALKWELSQVSTRCAFGGEGATDLGHIVYTRHPDSVELYHPWNMCLLHNACNTNERLWVNVNACLMILERAGGPVPWAEWAKTIRRRSIFWIPNKMKIAMDLWEGGVQPFEFEKIKEAVGVI